MLMAEWLLVGIILKSAKGDQLPTVTLSQRLAADEMLGAFVPQTLRYPPAKASNCWSLLIIPTCTLSLLTIVFDHLILCCCYFLLVKAAVYKELTCLSPLFPATASAPRWDRRARHSE